LASLSPVATQAGSNSVTPGEPIDASSPTASSASAGSAAPSIPATQTEQAEALYSCLVDRGFKASLEDMRPGETWVHVEAGDPDELIVQWWPDGRNYYWYAPQNTFPGLMADAADADKYQAWVDQMAGKAAESPYGYVVYEGEMDRTQDFEPCLQASGYVPPVLAQMDPANILEARQKQAEASNEWAACARAAGVPGVIDAKVSEDREEPAIALLPAGVTEAQIRRLVDECPAWDREVQEANDLAWAEGRDDDVRNQPMIGFDVDGYREREQEVVSPEDKAIYDPLYDLLFADREAYYDEKEAANPER
jgi:hypothetical protein